MLVLVVSLGLHLAGLFIFGAVKLAQTLTREEQVFQAPPVELAPPPETPPPPDLTQRNQQSAPPRPNPITVDSPDIELPALDIDVNVDTTTTGFGRGGLGKGPGGDTIREMSLQLNLSDFGYDKFVESTLEGTLFDFKQDRGGDSTGMSPGEMRKVSADFTDSFNTRDLKREYFSADKQLYASYFIIPFQSAESAPKAFDAADIIEPRMIGAVYAGTYAPRESGRFRLYGRGDDILVVRVNGKIVLDASWELNVYSEHKVDESDPSNFGERHFGFTRPGVYGDWFELKAGVETKVEVFISEVPGGKFGAWLTIEKKGNSDGPKVFHTRELSRQDRDFLLGLHPDSAEFLD